VVDFIGNYKVVLVIKSNPACLAQKLASAAAGTADGAQEPAVAQPAHLHAVVSAVENGDVTGAIDGNAAGCFEPPDGADVCPVAVPQNLNAVVSCVRNNDVPKAVESDAPRTPELRLIAP
jgi:hypothetical protein